MNSNADTSIFTQAFNFVSAAQGSVDPRTGLFLFNFPLGQLNGNNSRGPALPLALRYSPMLTADLYGLGIGMSLGLSSYDPVKRLLTLNTGENYKVDDRIAQKLVLKQQKLDTCHLNPCKVTVKGRERDGYQVIYKSGQCEYLTWMSGSKNLYLPACIKTPQGLRLTLQWDAYNRLTTITDDSNTRLFVATYNTKMVSVTLWPDSPSDRVMLTFQLGGPFAYESYLTNIINTSMQAENETLTWALDYSWSASDIRIAGKSLLTQVTAPTGLVEKVVYVADTMKVYAGAHQTALPAVVALTTTPKYGQPPVEETYQYSTTNYLGYDGTLQGEYSPDEDVLFGMADTYNYVSTVTRTDGQTTQRVKRTYNNYHLLTEEKSTTGNCTCTKTTGYFINPHAPFDAQPAVYQMPKTQTVTWTNEHQETRQEITAFDYEKDGAIYRNTGNILSQTAPDGTVTTFTYYSSTGETGCPADPYGFTRFLKTKTVTPPTLGNNEPVYTTTYTYDKLTLGGGSDDYAVVQTVKAVSAKMGTAVPVKLSDTAYTYNTTLKDPNFGRMTQQKLTVHGSDQTDYVTTQDFAFTTGKDADVGTLTQAFTTKVISPTGATEATLTSSRKLSVYTGLLLSETDAAGNTVTYDYDALGRLTKQTHHPDKPAYTSGETWAYTLPTETTPPQSVHTDILKNQTRTSYDGLGRVTSQEIDDRDSGQGNETAWQKVQSAYYDALGRGYKVDYADTLHKGSGGGNDESIAFSETLTWDDWGQATTKKGSDGVVAHTEKDPIALTTLSWTEGGEKQDNPVMTSAYHRVTYDKTSQCPVLSEVLDTKPTREEPHPTPYSTTSQTWDGLKRLLKQTDENGHQTAFEYDIYGRVTKTTFADGSAVSKEYAAFSSGALVNKISLTPKDGSAIVLGTQTFDCLGRLTETTSGGRTTTMTYEEEKPWQMTPSKVTGPDGVEYATTTDALLGEAPLSMIATASDTGRNVTHTFEYETKTGQMTSATEGTDKTAATAVTTAWSRYASGRLHNETSNIAAGGEQSTAFTYSVAGLLLQSTDVDGAVRSRTYTSQGQVQMLSTPDMTVTLSYDALQRPYKWVAQETSNGVKTKGTRAKGKAGASLTTVLAWDVYGRETQREITHSNGASCTVSQAWTVNNQLHTRTRKDKAGTCIESFTYDERNRLTGYTATGEEGVLPRDPYGNAMKGQTFTFDSLGNILTCETTLADKSVNKATYHFENKDDPCQLTSVVNNPKGKGYPDNITLKYDQAGRMTTDEAGRTLSYDALGRLQKVTPAKGQGGSYGYDARSRLVYQKVDETAQMHRLYYRASKLVNEWVTDGDSKQDKEKDSVVRLVYAGGGCVGQSTQKDKASSTMLVGTDGKQSVLTGTEGEETQSYVYSPYGYRAAEATKEKKAGEGEKDE